MSRDRERPSILPRERFSSLARLRNFSHLPKSVWSLGHCRLVFLTLSASIWPREHFCRRTIAPRWSSPTTWNEFLPISMPMVAMVAIDLLYMAVLRLTLAPSQHHSRWGRSTAGPFH